MLFVLFWHEISICIEYKVNFEQINVNLLNLFGNRYKNVSQKCQAYVLEVGFKIQNFESKIKHHFQEYQVFKNLRSQ